MISLGLRRALFALCITLIGYAVLEFAYFGQLRTLLAAQEDLQQQVLDLDKRLADSQRQLSALPAISTQTNQEGAFISATPEQSLVALQESVQGFVVATGGNITALQGTQDPGGGGIARMTVLVQASFSEQSLLSFVRQIESSPNLISIQKLDIQPPPTGQSGLINLGVTVVLGAVHKDAI